MKKFALACVAFAALVAGTKTAEAQYPYYVAPMYAPMYAYYPPVYVAPMYVAPVFAPVYAAPAYSARVKTYYRGQPARNVIRAVTPGARVYAY